METDVWNANDIALQGSSVPQNVVYFVFGFKLTFLFSEKCEIIMMDVAVLHATTFNVKRTSTYIFHTKLVHIYVQWCIQDFNLITMLTLQYRVGCWNKMQCRNRFINLNQALINYKNMLKKCFHGNTSGIWSVFYFRSKLHSTFATLFRILMRA